ncbi:hypothetical protein D9758_013642 [Tetrapyrgos nigripes]|uniref:Carboxylic ester hydrolase n=1 Tax=Tetrapyrgos nigripes TaxID=182062 RepID=A0A8H5CRR4_9AGAR|nr:hypothetical protein D9758_013642 [Tetrapyrgos nigripes]
MPITPLLLILAFLICTSVSASDPRVSMGDFTFVGRQISESVEFFGDVPFAEAPVGDLRLRPPILKNFTAGKEIVFNATHFGPSCIQTLVPAEELSEDCLTLSIFRPANLALEDKQHGLPVMIWFYGGGYIVGSSSMYDGTPLVNRSVFRGTPTIFIAANYRLGPLGFPRGDDVAREAASGSRILNLGLQDNIAALQWIQKHIASFGGDPSKVTVFGESAGAGAIEFLLLSSALKGLARAAIMESAGGFPAIPPKSSSANTVWNNFMAALPQCNNTAMTDDIECIRQLSTPEIIDGFNKAQLFFNTSGKGDWSPTADGITVPDLPSTSRPDYGLLEAVMMGNNKDEATLFTDQMTNSTQAIMDMILGSPPSPPNASPSQRKIQLQKLRHILNETLVLYPNVASLGSPFGTGNETFGLNPEYKRTAAVSTDFLFNAARRFHINQRLLPAGISTFSYLFADPDAVPVQDFVSGNPAPGSLGSTHSSEIFYVFGTLKDRPELREVTPTAAKLSKMMMDYWISFANVLNPNDGKGSSRPSWPEYEAHRHVLMQLNGYNTTAIMDDFRERQIALFSRDPAVFGQ